MTLLRSGHVDSKSAAQVLELDAFLAGNKGKAVSLPPDVDLQTLEPRLSGLKSIEILFPAFTDGRGFSIARQLRQQYGYKGELIAAGPLIPDQYVYALQCGFDAVRVDEDTFAGQSQQEWRNAMDAFDLTYQRGYVLPNGPAINIFEARKARRSPVLTDQYEGLSAQAALERAIKHDFKGQIALTSSMGVDSSVLLHMVSRIDPDLPVYFLETRKHFTETLDYKDILVSRLGLRKVIAVEPDADEIARLDPAEILYQADRDACCDLRKVRPLEKAISGYKVRITGRKRYQTKNRAQMPILETGSGQIALNPLAFWSARDVTAYMRKHDLPPHPLLKLGFLSVGCAPCTTRVEAGEDARAGRWRDSEKDECGIHFIDGKWVRTKQQPTMHADYI